MKLSYNLYAYLLLLLAGCGSNGWRVSDEPPAIESVQAQEAEEVEPELEPLPGYVSPEDSKLILKASKIIRTASKGQELDLSWVRELLGDERLDQAGKVLVQIFDKHTDNFGGIAKNLIDLKKYADAEPMAEKTEDDDLRQALYLEKIAQNQVLRDQILEVRNLLFDKNGALTKDGNTFILMIKTTLLSRAERVSFLDATKLNECHQKHHTDEHDIITCPPGWLLAWEFAKWKMGSSNPKMDFKLTDLKTSIEELKNALKSKWQEAELKYPLPLSKDPPAHELDFLLNDKLEPLFRLIDTLVSEIPVELGELSRKITDKDVHKYLNNTVTYLRSPERVTGKKAAKELAPLTDELLDLLYRRHLAGGVGIAPRIEPSQGLTQTIVFSLLTQLHKNLSDKTIGLKWFLNAMKPRKDQ
ncbi:MAG: hypothetical protein V4534_07670 [Myxococcota bacterium]